MKKFAFISYVRENAEQVDRLRRRLTESGVKVWLDRTDIQPGARWKDAIRSAISDGAFFLACFSKESAAKSRSYMNEELSLAIDELRLRPTDRAWFIPLKLNECTISERAIGGGQRLSDIHYVDLSGDWNAGIGSLLDVLVPADAEITNLYSVARETLVESIGRSRPNVKTDEFTVGFTGMSGVGISLLLRLMKGFHGDVVRRGESPIARDGVEVHRIDGVGRILDIRTMNRMLLCETLEKEVDFLVYVIPVNNRVHEQDLEEIRALPKELPSLVAISKWDLANHFGETSLYEALRSHTGRPVVVFSRELAQTSRLMNQMLCELRTLYKRPSSRLWRLFHRDDASE